MPYTAAGVEHANTGGVSSLTDQIGNMNLNTKPSSSRTGWNMTTSDKGVRGGKSKRNNSRKKIRKNRRTNKTRRSKK